MFRKNLFTKLFGFLQTVGSTKRFSQKIRVHNYTAYKLGRDYAFDQMNDGDQAYMTAYGRNVRPGDYILVSHAGVKQRYRVEQIDYYANPSDMWIASLVKCQPESNRSKARSGD
jgi:hypothetical protein